MLRAFKNILEAYGDEASRDTFEGELNYEAGKLCFTIVIAMIVWLPYISHDLELHQFPKLAVSIRIGITLLCICLIILKFTKRFRNRPNMIMMIMLGYFYFGTAIITATAGEHIVSYTGGFCFVMMLVTFAPFVLRYKVIYVSISFLLFIIIGSFHGLSYSNISIQYSLNDLSAAAFTAICLSVVLNNVKYTSWDRRQKLKAASKAKSDFLTRMSHEIRTPMNAITGMAELALREDISHAAREHVLTIKQAGAHLLSVINDILDFSKIESGKLEIIPSYYLFSSLVNDVVNIVRTRITDTNVQLIVSIDSKIPNALFGDETRIRQIMLNILNNAVKFTKKGYVVFVVSGKISNEDTVSLAINVIDTGIGIKQEDTGKLFGDFVQLDTIANRGIEGTGLGLAITENLVEAMGGSINVISHYGKGSIFTIILPQKIHSHEPVAELDLNKTGAIPCVTTKFSAPTAKVLIVDDINTNLKVAKGLMLPYNMQVDLCLSGAEAIKMIKANAYDLVFMDHMMPEMDGIEATKRIREFSDVPIIALTANAISGVKDMFIANGFNDFLSKPIEIIKLDSILDKWIPKEKHEKPAAEISLQEQNSQILAAFHKDGTQGIEDIKKCLEASNYSLYTTYVHGLKSAAANVGARELSELAKELEEAGRRGDHDFIKTNNEAFLFALQTYLNNISKALPAKETTDFEMLKAELVKLRKAITEFDLAAIDKSVRALQEFAEAENILQNTLIGEHDEAISLIDNLLKEIE